MAASSPNEMGVTERLALDARSQQLAEVRAGRALLAVLARVPVLAPALVALACPVAGADLGVGLAAPATGRLLVAAAVGAAP